MAATVEIIGLKEANRALKQLPDLAKVQVQQVNDVTAFRVATDASRKAPRSHDGSHGHAPGFLQSSIRWESRPRSVSAVVGVAAAAFYWKFLEYGARKMSAKPFLRPSADSNRADHRTRLLDALTRAARKVSAMAK